jgi:hypothetical protein
VNEPALLAGRRTGSQAAGQAASFAALGPPGDWKAPAPHRPQPQWQPQGKGRGSKGKGGGKEKKRGGKGSVNKGVKHTHNAAGTQLCYAWGRAAHGCASPCPNERAHQCEFCLGPHRTIDPNCLSKPAGWTPPAPRK